MISKRASFTLIELLVVISIIAILAAMIMPTIGTMREKGRAAKCKANLKNLQSATMSYLYDGNYDKYSLPASYPHEVHDDQKDWSSEMKGWVNWTGYKYIATSGHSGAIDPDAGIWPIWWGEEARTSITNGSLWVYIGKNLKTYLCPTFKLTSVCSASSPVNTPFDPVRSYVMNSQANEIELKYMTNASRKILFAEQSVEKMIKGVTICRQSFKDNSGANMKSANDGNFNGTPVGANPYSVEAIAAYHSGKGNVVFIDGHVETLSWKNTTNACSGNW